MELITGLLYQAQHTLILTCYLICINSVPVSFSIWLRYGCREIHFINYVFCKIKLSYQFKNAILKKIQNIPTLCLLKYICCIRTTNHQMKCFEHKTNTIKETNHCNLIATISLYKIAMMETLQRNVKKNVIKNDRFKTTENLKLNSTIILVCGNFIQNVYLCSILINK